MSGAVLLRAVIPGDPVPKGRPRLVVGAGRPHVHTPRRTARAEEHVGWHVREALPAGFQPITEPIAISLRFWLGSQRARDLDNLVKLCWDALNKIVWEDDSQIQHVDATIMGRDRHAPRTELEVRLWP